MDYNQFLDSKLRKAVPTGIEVPVDQLNKHLFDYQRDIVQWALKRGRAAIFSDCGTGKSLMELEWATQVPGDVLLFAPLAVGPQTVREAAKFGIESVGFAKDGTKQGKITVTNFANWEKYNPDDYNAVVLDESSILKNENGKMRNAFIEQWQNTPFRLAATATPSPNDFIELGNHSEFLSVLKFSEVQAEFFIHDSGDTKEKWRLKKHAASAFWQWVATWAVYLRNPADLGYKADGFNLPALQPKEVIVPTENTGPYLFQMAAKDLQERITARRETVAERARVTADLIKAKGGKWVVWCNLNSEADAIKSLLPDAVEVRGSDSDEAKSSRMLGFSNGDFDILITKPKVAGFGMNWQHCHQMAFVGLSDSYEQYYQALRRCWRYGQNKPVDAYLIVSDREGSVLENIKRKDKQAEEMATMMTENMQDLTKAELGQATKQKSEYTTDCVRGKNWTAYHGDCVDVVRSLPDDSIGYSIFSPPFASLYTFSNAERDMSNVKSHGDFFGHFHYLIKDLYRVMMPGRLVSIHCCNLPKSLNHDGVIGIYDFRGDIIRAFEKYGFVYHSEVTIWKDPVVAMQRTKALGLLHKQVMKDSAMSRQGIPDYLVTMRKIGQNPEPIAGKFDAFNGSGDYTPEEFAAKSAREYFAHGWGGDDQSAITDGQKADIDTRLSIDIWQRYASPVWMDIRQGDVLPFRGAREDADERHITPLQLGVIERGMDLWSNPGDTVLSPFMGVGSEGHVALGKGRKFIGAELKGSYFNAAVGNLTEAEESSNSGVLPGLLDQL